ncbi:MAG: M23 family metallopeptidase [Gemmatimonadota bacterium]|nr:M23 family metallopeptidase [Gemmatimonadota bacterium]
MIRLPARLTVPARAATLVAAVALAGAVLTLGRWSVPLRSKNLPALAIAAAPDSTIWTERVDTLHRGETLNTVLARVGLTSEAMAALLKASPIDARRVPAEMPVTVRSSKLDGAPSEVIFHLAIDRLVHLRFGPGGWTGDERRLPWTTDTVVASGTIQSTLYEALDKGAAGALPRGARAELAWALADVYEYRVDMSRELQPGDSLRVLFTRLHGPEGAVKVGEILAARFELSGARVEAIKFDEGGPTAFFDQSGKSMRGGFLRAPLEFRRISSVFGLRKHPILGIWRAHTGTDYAANAGTPVRSIGDGTVIFAGRKGGYGNALEIRHRNGYVSRYGHLRAYAKGTKVGRHVGIGETVAFVGMTGLATAPHLHFEILVNGVQRDPRRALSRQDGAPVSESARAAFDARRSSLLAALDLPGGAEKQIALR